MLYLETKGEKNLNSRIVSLEAQLKDENGRRLEAEGQNKKL